MVRVIRRDGDETTQGPTARSAPSQPRSSVIGRETVEAKSEASDILEDARTQAQSLIDAATSEAEAL